MNYRDIDMRKTAFIFELDDVLYPEKDYLYQVYYLFASLLEYTELIDAKETTNLLINTYISEGKDCVFDRVKERFNINEKHRQNLNNLLINAKLPLKLLLYKKMLSLPKPESDVIDLLIKDHSLQRRDLLMIANSETDKLCAEGCGIDYVNSKEFL